ncbi:MAG: pseudouridine synthase [Kangiellaceae bacterium]|jgi:tRNA pseudouridine65 synthase|nr:pseudouridine synthase [Kangiellaceae bacterium]
MTERIHQIIYQDDYLVAVNKPENLLVHRSEIDKHETRFLIQELRDQIGQRVYPIHRLDKPTSGLILFALDKNTQSIVSQQFENNLVNKTYLAVVRGHIDRSITIDHALKEKSVFKSQNKDALPTKEAITRVRSINKFEINAAIDKYPTSRYNLIMVKPKTGRRHQIRRHLKHISHPIIGDTSYGKTTHNQYFRDNLNCNRLMLHAYKISFCHPTTNKPMNLHAKTNSNFTNTIVRLSE